MIKKLKLIFTILLLYLSLPSSSLSKINIIASVDNEIITSQDIENEIQYLKTLNPNIKNLSKERLILIGKNLNSSK